MPAKEMKWQKWVGRILKTNNISTKKLTHILLIIDYPQIPKMRPFQYHQSEAKKRC